MLNKIIFLSCFIYLSLQSPAISNDENFYTNLNKINDELVESQKNYTQFIDKSLAHIKEIFKIISIENFGSNITKKFLLEQIENARISKVPIIRHKRQADSSTCISANSKVAVIKSQLDAAYAYSNETNKKLVSAQVILNNLQTTKPNLKGIDPAFNFYLTIIWQLIVRLQTNSFLIAQKNIANLESQLSAQQAQATASCVITIASTTTQTSLQACPYTWSSYAGNNQPPSDAFYVGKGQFGNDIYIGAGSGNGDLAPGSLEPKVLNGVTMESGWVVYNVTRNVQYLAIPSTCKCEWIKQGNLDTLPALVRLRDYYWVGRHTFDDGSFAVGKIWKEPTWYMNYADDRVEKEVTTYDVLQCYVNPTTTSLSSTTTSPTTLSIIASTTNAVSTAAPPKCANCGIFQSCIIGSPINCVCDGGKVQIPCLTIILGYCCL